MKVYFNLLITAFLLVSSSLIAGKEKMNARINASSFSVGNAVAVADNKFPNVTIGNTANVKSSIARVTLGLDNTASIINHLGNTNTYLRVGVKITHCDVNGNYSTQIRELTINHNATGLTNDRSNVVIKNAHMIVARILYFKNSSNIIVPSPFIPSNIFMEAEVETERYYPLNVNTLPTLNHFYHTNTNELEVYWNSVPGAEEYELEYTFVNNVAATSTSYDYQTSSPAIVNATPPTALPFTFNNNATRIRTSKNNFFISLNYNQGMIVYRMRAIGRSMLNTDLEVIGNWTLNQPQTTASLQLPASGFNDYYVISTGHEPNKNWQVTTTFAEDGKKKDVIGYFDGSNRKRQIVTRTNTENISLIGETIYDSQGRHAITVLPAPDANYSMQLKYFENFNQSATQPFAGGAPVPYSRLDFENSNSSTCPVPARGMYTGVVTGGANGAAVYYSANNTNKENQNAYIPDAKKYPFTHQVYTPDNTGQVRYQSGVGETHKIGSTHETKTLEGDPDQEDLDKLFGSEAGYAEKYKKTMAVDPNGQISVSYLNTEGKVVATALAGNAPQNTTQLSNLSVYPKSSKYMNYSDGNYNFINLAANGALTFKKRIIPDITGTYNFFYDLTVPQYTDNCISSFCYDCAYDLEIKLMDECNAVIYSQSASVGQPVDYTCGAPLYFSSTGFSPAFNAYLTAGKEYFLTKVLTINNDAMNQYLNHYTNIANNSCIKDLAYFQAQAMAGVDTNDCHMTCATCTTAIQNYWTQHNDANKANPQHPTYDPNYIYMSPAQKQAAIDNCLKPCKPISLCQAEFETMLQDMRPMGQYAQYTVTGSAYNAQNFEVSILNEYNLLRISTLYGSSQAVNAGTPFKTYAINVKSSWRNPEYFNASAHNFSSPDASVNQMHYFDANGNVSKVRLIPLPTNLSGYYPDVVNSTPQTNLTSAGVYTDNQGYWTFPENLADLKDFVFAYSNNPHWAYSLVKSHPEFNYFLDCDRQSDPALYTPSSNPYTSEQFDADLRSANSMSEAYGTSGTINSGQSKWLLVYDNTTPDLLNSDPYFSSTGPGASLYNTMLARLYTNYQGTGTSLKQVTAQMYSTAQMYYAPPACTSAATFGGTSLVCNSVTYPITTASLNEMWKSYREMYLIEKQKLLMETAHIQASNPAGNVLRNNYYNGAIGNLNFSPWDSYIKYNFNPFFIPGGSFGAPFGTWGAGLIQNNPSFWPDYHNSQTGIPTNSIYNPLLGKGYFDFGSPSSFYHKSRYGNKIRRVPDLQTLSNMLAGGASDPNDIMSNLNANVEAQIFASTGQCPIYKRLELFLNMTARKGTLFTFNTVHPLVAEPAFTQQMYDAIISCAGLTPTTWIPLGFQVTQSGGVLTIQFFNLTSGQVPLGGADIVLTNLSSTSISNWSFVKGFKDIQFNGSIGGTATFNLKALYQTSSSMPYSVLPFKGTTCIQSSCPELSNTVNTTVCKPSQQALELQDFLSAVVSDKQQNITMPVNLGNTAASNSANFFTILVRYPFSTAAVTAAPSHTVNLVNSVSSSIITLAGVDGLNQTIIVDFVFTPASGSGPQNLNTAFSLSNIQPNVTSSTGYDFTIKAHYPGNITQTFSVSIVYPSGLCSAAASNGCRFYVLKNCEPFVSGSCANNPAYKTMVQLQDMLTDIFTFSNGVNIPTSNLTTYINPLQSQFGPTINTFQTSTMSVPNGTTGLTNYTVHVTMASPVKNCRMTLTTTSSVPPNLFSTGNLVFTDIEAINAPSNQFTIAATNGSNTYTFTGIAPCLEMDNCTPCKENVIIHSQTFEGYTNQTTTAALNFASARYEPTNYNPAVACTFQGATCAPNTSLPIGNFGDLSIQSLSSCMGFADHTSSGTKYLQAYIFHPLSSTYVVPPSTYVEPWKNNGPLTTIAGKTYSVSFWFNYAQDNNMFRIQLLVNDGTNDILLSEKNVDFNNTTTYTPSQWQPMTALYNANSTSSTFKIKILTLGSAADGYVLTNRVAIDDIVITQLGCEKETAVPLVADPPENDCVNQLINIAMSNAQQQYNNYMNTVTKDFTNAYTQKCYRTLERLNADYQSSEGHYTLYYYDQGGNLIKTVPPAGVEPINLSAIDPVSGLAYGIKIKSDRDNKQKTVFTNHRMATRYEYNSLNQLIRQHMPDHSDVELYSANAMNNPPAPVINMDFSNNTTGYMIGSNGSGTTLYMTSNGGNTWVQPTGLTTADIIDIDYAGNTAYAIVSDGSILKSTTYNTSTPVWQQVILPGSNTMLFTDIEFYSTNDGYITGKNGLLLVTNDGGLTWTSINLGTGQDLNKIDFRNDGSGVYGVIAGNYGTIFYTTPSNLSSNLWNMFGNLSTGIDLLNVSILSTGNGSSSYMTIFVSGIDNNITPGRGTVIQVSDINGTMPLVTNLYINQNGSAVSKIHALSSAAYMNGSTSVIDVFFGGTLYNFTPSPILQKLQYTSAVPSFNLSSVSVAASTQGINDLVITDAGQPGYNVRGVTQNGELIYFSGTGSSATNYALNTIGTAVNTSACKRINVDPSTSSTGLISGVSGTIIRYNTSGFTSQSQSAITFPSNLNAVSAAKDGSGIVYAVGNSGSIVRSMNNGATWQLVNLAPGTVNLQAVKYVPATIPKVLIAGNNGYVAELDPSANTILAANVLSSSNTYKTIETPSGNNTIAFIGGGNPANAKIEQYTLGNATSLTSKFTGSAANEQSINKLSFFNTGNNSGLSYAVGNNGTILKSIDNWNNTTVLTSGTSNQLNDVVIKDQYTAMVFGNSSTILKTTDAGSSWNAKNTPGSTNITSVYTFPNGSVLAGGTGAVNLFTVNDEGGDYSTRFFYDALGRLIISQNAKQFAKNPKAYSYTTYDALGRITQVGEIAGPSMSDPSLLTGSTNGVVALAMYSWWLGTGTKSEVTSTVYDVAVASPCSFTQDNLRKRVSASYIDNDANLNNGYTHATFYSYDIHGNVKTLMQVNPAMGAGQSCKRLDYSYDLLSGKVNRVDYQAGEPDAFHHKYDYDADNRVTNVFTSKDGVDWQQDAKYFYYLHGPLSRVELGNDKVQALDYAYTIQGWIKGMNSVGLDKNNDIGKDGTSGTQYNSTITDLHKYVSYDAASYALNYFNYNNGTSQVSDYTAIDAAKNTTGNRFDSDVTGHGHFTAQNSLFNGNIMAMATTIYTDQPVLASANPAPQLAFYKYDQLNRLKQMNTTQNLALNQWSSASATNAYKNYFVYDANGNILKQKRYNNTGTVLDSMNYQYHFDGAGKMHSNRLYHVNDLASGAAANDDIDDQGSFTPAPISGTGLGQINSLNNYAYDAIGNLVKDVQEGIANIDWTVYGKIKEITRTTTSTSKNLIFTYDATGNRIGKTSYNNGQQSNQWESTYYVRDAQGNVMATYEYKPQGAGPQVLSLVEHPIYGSTRLGMRNYIDQNNISFTSPYLTSTNTYTMELKAGNVSYEMSNHLGNVVTVVSDRKMPVPVIGNPTQVDHYAADLLSSNDYYAFGAPMAGRKYQVATRYRYGFNGKENDRETVGTSGGTQDYGMRIYNPALGRFLSVDPITDEYPELTPYQFASNKPITSIDLDGLEELDVVKKYDVENKLRSESVRDIPLSEQDPKITAEKGKVRITQIKQTTDKPLITVTYSDEIPEPLKTEFDQKKVENGNQPLVYKRAYPFIKGRLLHSSNESKISKDIVLKEAKSVLDLNEDRVVMKVFISTSSDKLKNSVGEELKEEYAKQFPKAEIVLEKNVKVINKRLKEIGTTDKNAVGVRFKFRGDVKKD